MRPQLTFFCELQPQALQALFSNAAMLEHLQALQARISLGLPDFSDERAAVVRRLNEMGIPVVGWQLLPREQGYWFNADNYAHAEARYASFRRWSEEHGLQWAGIGLDFEPDIREMEAVAADRRQLVPFLTRHVADTGRIARGQQRYAALVAKMARDGYYVEGYHMPFIVDERIARSTLIQRATGIVDVATDCDVLMLYSSHLPFAGGSTWLWSYGQDAPGIAIGSTGGGVDGETVNALDWEAFSQDLQIASALSPYVYIFSLEGSVGQGFLARLQDFDWDADPCMPRGDTRALAAARRGLRGALWAGSHPLPILAAVFALWAIRRARKR